MRFHFLWGFCLCLRQYGTGTAKRLWLLPLLMVVWVNIHGLVCPGLGTDRDSVDGAVVRHVSCTPQAGNASIRHKVAAQPLAVWGVLTALATLLQPTRGWGACICARSARQQPGNDAGAKEWAPPTVRDTSGAIFFIFVIGCFLAIGLCTASAQLTDVLLFVAFLWGWHLAQCAISSGLGLSRRPSCVWRLRRFSLSHAVARRRDQGMLNGMPVGLLSLMLLIGLPVVEASAVAARGGGAALGRNAGSGSAVPAAPAQICPQHLFHEMGYGSLHRFGQRLSSESSIDPRIELYPFEQWRDYINLGQGNNTRELFARLPDRCCAAAAQWINKVPSLMCYKHGHWVAGAVSVMSKNRLPDALQRRAGPLSPYGKRCPPATRPTGAQWMCFFAIAFGLG